MAKKSKGKLSPARKGKSPINDQNTGPQQLYEDRKLGHPDLKDAITADLKSVRKRVSKKINNRLLNKKNLGTRKSNNN